MEVTTLIAYVIAVAVPAFFLYMIFALDLYGTGKGSTVFISFVWGAVGAFGLALTINNAAVSYINRVSVDSNGYEMVVTVFAPIVEELLKSAVLVFLIQRPRFRYIVDGAIYGFAVGIGFAITENIFYVSNNPEAGLVLAISRVLSATLMHATASGLVGIALGRLRRSQSGNIIIGSVIGLLLAMGLHILYNNLLQRLEGIPLLLVAIGIGMSGGIFIAWMINQGLNEEKKRFEQTLGTNVGVSIGERKAVQQLGESGIEKVLAELGEFYGEDKVEKIRRLLVIQANVGILNNNLSTQVSPRLRKAWEGELAGLRKEADDIRNDLGVYIMGFVRNLFPADDNPKTNLLNQELVKSDPSVIHQFDIFINASARAGTFTPEQLEEFADLLKQVEFFKAVDPADLENLSRAIVNRTYTAGQVLFEQGAEGDMMYLIRQGKIDLFTNDGGAERLLRTCHPGEVVGELALLDGQKRSAKAVANGQLSVLMLRREQFMMFISSRPMVMIAILQFLAKRVRYVTELVEAGISWARELAEGNYQKAAVVAGALAPSAGLPNVESVAPTVAASPNKRDTGSGGPAKVGGAFSMITAALEQREHAADMKSDSAGLKVEVDHLPEAQREVVKLLLQDPSAAMTGISLEHLQTKLPAVEGLHTVLDELVKSNWVITLGTAPHIRYKANINRKRAKVALPTKPS